MRKDSSPGVVCVKTITDQTIPIPVSLLHKRNGDTLHPSLELLQQRNDLLRCAAEAARLGYFVLNRRTRQLECSQELQNIFETAECFEPILSGRLCEHFSKDDYELLQLSFTDAINGNYHPVTFRLTTPSGKTKVLKTIFSGHHKNGHQDLIFGTTQDITPIKEKQAENINRGKELRSIMEAAPVLILKTNLSMTVEYINKKIDGLAGEKITNLFDAEFQEVILQKTVQVISEGGIAHLEARGSGLKKAAAWYKMTIKKVNQAGLQPFLLFIIQDVTETKQIEQKIFNAISEAEEKERNRISAELHDGVCQNLSTIHLLLTTLENRNEKTDTEVKQLYTTLRELTLETLGITRNLSHELMPVDLAERGFLKTIETMLCRLNSFDKIRYTMDVSGKEMPLPKAVSIQLYRIIQEFIRNSQKHSGATEVILRIKLSDASMELLLTDNGRGFDMEKEQANGIGLLNMTKRVRVFNGKCLYKTGEGKGVRLHILVPLSNIESGSQTKNYTC